MKSKKLILTVSAVICVLALSVGVTLAAFSAKTTTLNVLTFGNVHIDLIDDYTRPEKGVAPGETVAKVVSAKNTGKNVSYVRIYVDKAWCDLETGAELDRLEYNPDYIVLNIKDPEMWVDGGDGYWYYQEPLEPGQTAENLMESFSLPADWDMKGYNRLEGHITVQAEAIQYDNFHPIRDERNKIVSWGDAEIKEALPEVTYTFTGSTDDSNVTFQYGTHDFVVIPDDKDLFRNFKGLMPGDSKTQTIQIKNENDDHVMIWLYALPADITDFSDVPGSTAEHQKVLSDDLVNKLNITITKESTGKVLYDGKLVGKSDTQNFQDEKNALYLGDYVKGASDNLLLTLSVPTELDNTYDDAIAKIQWVFVARNDDVVSSEPESSEPESSEPESSEPESSEPESSEPESSVPESSEPESSIPESSEPESSAPESSEPESSEPESSAPESSEPESSVPESSEPESSKPESSVPDAGLDNHTSNTTSSTPPSTSVSTVTPPTTTVVTPPTLDGNPTDEPLAPPVQTGDDMGKYIVIGAIVLVSLVVIILLVVLRKKKNDN